MISNRRAAPPVRRWSIGVGLAGAAAMTAGMIGLAIAPSAHADDTTVDLNGWTVQTDSTGSATLLDPTDSLGNGTQLTGSFESTPSAFDHLHSNDLFNSDSPNFMSVDNTWTSPWLVVSTVEANDGSASGAIDGYLTTNLGGNEVVDLYNSPDSYPPLFSPGATGTVDVGGLALASPQDGALFNDLYDAIFTGDIADWGNAATLFGDLFSL
jgi:hypothetical protein